MKRDHQTFGFSAGKESAVHWQANSHLPDDVAMMARNDGDAFESSLLSLTIVSLRQTLVAAKNVKIRIRTESKSRNGRSTTKVYNITAYKTDALRPTN